MPKRYPTLKEQAEANRDRPWYEATPNINWTQADYYEIARPFQIIYEALIPLGFAISYHQGVSLPEVAHLWGIYKGDESGYICYNVEQDTYYIIGVSMPDPRPEIPDGVKWVNPLDFAKFV